MSAKKTMTEVKHVDEAMVCGVEQAGLTRDDDDDDDVGERRK